ncbi:hypothetical protein TCAL_17186 [Tigriopus californicus]|uniref:aspartate transaminase n=1 Tax=Tigriopus californicus TaxID=6832 RepID=A0A553N8T7_TIGCA|nr:hypothetical protein TCAL_17186 [Tigriopus californicus]
MDWFSKTLVSPNARTYRYWDKRLVGSILRVDRGSSNAPEGAVIILHACAHNPTGIDPSPRTVGHVLESPAHGSRIVDLVLKDEQLFKEWCECIKVMSSRIIEMRQGLRERLEKLNTPGQWNHITEQIGMFFFHGTHTEMCQFLLKEKHVYLLKNGRISMCGVTPSNLDYLAESINEAVNKFKK